jgi:hypothetical protein
LRPVEKVDQETGVCEGIVGRRGEKLPCARSLARFGSFPSSIHFWVSLASAPSKPRMISFLGGCCWAPSRDTASGAAAKEARARRTRDRARSFEVIGDGFPESGVDGSKGWILANPRPQLRMWNVVPYR